MVDDLDTLLDGLERGVEEQADPYTVAADWRDADHRIAELAERAYHDAVRGGDPARLPGVTAYDQRLSYIERRITDLPGDERDAIVAARMEEDPLYALQVAAKRTRDGLALFGGYLDAAEQLVTAHEADPEHVTEAMVQSYVDPEAIAGAWQEMGEQVHALQRAKERCIRRYGVKRHEWDGTVEYTIRASTLTGSEVGILGDHLEETHELRQAYRDRESRIHGIDDTLDDGASITAVRVQHDDAYRVHHENIQALKEMLGIA